MDAATLEELKYPIGKFDYSEPFAAEKIRGWIDAIEALPNWLDICIENLDAAQLDTRYRPEGWTVNQVLHHIADSHMNGYTRHKLTLTEDNPTIKPYNEKLWSNLPDIEHTPVNVSITLVHALHRRWGQLLDNLKPEDWHRTYYHPEDDRQVPLWQSVAVYAWHGRHHMEHVRRLRERMGWW